MALLLLRHALNITNADGDDDDASNFFSVSEICVVDMMIIFMLIYIYILYIYGYLEVVSLLKCLWFFTAFLAKSCWFSSPLLHHGLGDQYIAASKTETG